MLAFELGNIDTAEAYMPLRSIEPEARLRDGDDLIRKLYEYYSEEQLEQVATEARILGIDPSHQPDRFIDAHNALLAEMEVDLNEALPTIKRKVIEGTAAYFADGDAETRLNLERLLSRRLQATIQVMVVDSLVIAQGNEASFSLSRQPKISSHELVYRLDTCKDIEEYHSVIYDVVLAHELMHGMVTSALSQDGDLPIRNGLNLNSISRDGFLSKVSKYGDWVNEATIESFRQTILKTPDVYHETSVMVLHTLGAFLPGLRDRLVIAALDRQDPRLAFTEIETLLGVNAISNVKTILSTIEDLDELKDRFTRILPQHLQMRGRMLMEEQEVKLLGHLPEYQEWLIERQAS